MKINAFCICVSFRAKEKVAYLKHMMNLQSTLTNVYIMRRKKLFQTSIMIHEIIVEEQLINFTFFCFKTMTCYSTG